MPTILVITEEAVETKPSRSRAIVPTPTGGLAAKRVGIDELLTTSKNKKLIADKLYLFCMSYD